MGLNKRVKEHNALLHQITFAIKDIDERLKVLEAKLAKEENKGVAH